MTLQDKERFKKMCMFAENASSIAEGISLKRLTEDNAYQYSLLYPLGQIKTRLVSRVFRAYESTCTWPAGVPIFCLRRLGSLPASILRRV